MLVRRQSKAIRSRSLKSLEVGKTHCRANRDVVALDLIALPSLRVIDRIPLPGQPNKMILDHSEGTMVRRAGQHRLWRCDFLPNTTKWSLRLTG